MKNNLFFKSTYVAFLIVLFTSLGLAQSISKIEPPHWYVGMNNPELQIMFYGENIGHLTPSIKEKGITIEEVHRVKNPNYLFVDFELSPNVKAGDFQIKLKDGKKTILKKKYCLKERIEDSANRASFSAKDAIYLITPDRFANGNPANDEIAGMKEGFDRSIDYGRHGGDIQGMIDHLDYIKDMGFTAIWINPLTENDQDSWSYHGYATTDYYKIDRRFGSNKDYLRLVKLAKEKGLGIIMDQIANHCGHQHWWMEDLPTDDWINYQDQEYQGTNHRKSSLLDPYASPEDRKILTNGWFVPTMPDLNQRNPLLKKYLIQNTIWWIEYANLYGIRQDTYSYPFKEFMTDWTCAIKAEYPHFNVVGEEWFEDPGVIAYWQEGKLNQDGYTSCLKSIMDFPMNVTLDDAFNGDEKVWGQGLIKLYEIMGQDYHYADPMNLVVMPDNHDMSRIWEQLKYNLPNFKMAVTFILTTRGIPQIYYGTEILMDHPGTDAHGMIRSDFPGGWQGDATNGFTGNGLSTEAKSVKAYIKNVLQWRKTAKAIHTGKLMHYEPRYGTYVYFRFTDQESYMIILNKNQENHKLDLGRFNRFLSGKSSLYNVITKDSMPINNQLILEGPGAYVFRIDD